MTNSFKAALERGERQIGLWSTLCSTMVADVLSDADFDWICIDNEHSPNDLPEITAQLQVYRASRFEVIVRAAWNDTVLIKRLLDAGARTLLVPFIQTPEEARAAVAATRYPPTGMRGVTGSGRASRFGRSKDYLATASERIAVLVQIETAQALARLEEIAAVEGVDGVFIGPSDLAASLGHLGNSGHPDVQAALKDAVSRLKAVGKPAGTLTMSAEEGERYVGWGYAFVGVGSDVSLLLRGADVLAERFRRMSVPR